MGLFQLAIGLLIYPILKASILLSNVLFYYKWVSLYILPLKHILIYSSVADYAQHNNDVVSFWVNAGFHISLVSASEHSC